MKYFKNRHINVEEPVAANLKYYLGKKYPKHIIYSLNRQAFIKLNAFTKLKKSSRFVYNNSMSSSKIYYHEKYILFHDYNEYFIVFKSKDSIFIEKTLRKIDKELKSTENLSTYYERFVKEINNLHINIDIKEKVMNYMKLYFSSMTIRQQLQQNKNMSIIFTGEPGDGKTYLATEILYLANKYFGLTVVRDEDFTFGQASKMVKDFCALIDDMNISHFSRKINPEICSIILSEMDRPSSNRLFILTTNEKISRDEIDSAFFRPGRVEGIIEFSAPTASTRRNFLEEIFCEKTEEILEQKIPKGFIDAAVESSCKMSYAQINRFKDMILSSVIETGEFNIKKALSDLENVNRYLDNQESNYESSEF